MGALSSTSIIGSRIASLPAIYAPKVTNQAHHKKLNCTYPFELMSIHNHDVHFKMTHDQKKIKIGPKPNTSKDVSYELSSKHSSSKPCAHNSIYSHKDFKSICLYLSLCVCVSLGFWFLDYLFCSPIGGCVCSALSNSKLANHTPQQQHENIETQRKRETER